MKQATTTLLGGLAILLAPTAIGQMDGDAAPPPQESMTGAGHTLSGVLLPNIQRESLPISRPAMGRIAERILVTPSRGVEPSAVPGLALSDAAIHDRLHHDVAPDGTIWVRGADFKASADASGFSFVPFLGSHAPQNFPVDFRLVGAVRDGASLFLRQRQTPGGTATVLYSTVALSRCATTSRSGPLSSRSRFRSPREKATSC